MTTESREHLSSFMDGEQAPEASRFLVRRLSADGELRDTWARYHLIRDCLRHQDGHIAQSGMSTRVSAALSTDAMSGDPAASAGALVSRNWLKPMAGVALAASVALLAVFTVSNVGTPGLLQPALNCPKAPRPTPKANRLPLQRLAR